MNWQSFPVGWNTVAIASALVLYKDLGFQLQKTFTFCLPDFELFSSGTIVLGPWVSFQEYRKIFINPRWNVTWLIKILFTVRQFVIANYSKKRISCMQSRPCPNLLFSKVTFAFMFLTISTCWNPWLIPDSGWKWWIAYRSRFSKSAHN